MPPARAQNPFALYADGRSVAGNTESIGLGLAFVQTTALRHNGTADYVYEEGYGARFTLTLTLAEAE